MPRKLTAHIDDEGKVILDQPVKLESRTKVLITILKSDKQVPDDASFAERIFERNFGAISSGRSNSADNELLDAELGIEN